MKAKLIKDEDGYSLFTREENSTNRKFIATTQGMYVDHKLSKQNCDEIFGVVDVIDVVYKQVRNGFDGVIDSFTEAFAKECINKAMKLYQPTEIEVEIETETKVWEFISNGEFESFEIIPKLDSNKCLILKKL
jgi:hypothetical protein